MNNWDRIVVHPILYHAKKDKRRFTRRFPGESLRLRERTFNTLPTRSESRIQYEARRLRRFWRRQIGTFPYGLVALLVTSWSYMVSACKYVKSLWNVWHWPCRGLSGLCNLLQYFKCGLRLWWYVRIVFNKILYIFVFRLFVFQSRLRVFFIR